MIAHFLHFRGELININNITRAHCTDKNYTIDGYKIHIYTNGGQLFEYLYGDSTERDTQWKYIMDKIGLACSILINLREEK